MRTTRLLLLLGWMVFVPTTAAQTILFSENFDGVTAPAPPAGWTIGDGWDTRTSSASPGSGANNLTHSGSGLGSADTPVIDLSTATGATLSYLARRTDSYDIGNLRVLGSNDGGVTFPTTILGAGSALPVDGSTYDSIGVALPADLIGSSTVVVRFEGLGLSSSSSNARIDDVLITSSSTPPPSDGGTISFSTSETVAQAQDVGIQVPLTLDLSAPDGLQGLQFRASWDIDSLLAIAVNRGSALVDTDSWTVDFETGENYVDVVILGAGTTSLPSGTYAPLVTLEFNAGAADLTQVGSIRLQNVVGALATPEATDAGIAPGSDHAITLTGRVANFVASALNLDAGLVQVGDPDSVLFTVSHPDGQTDLVIDSVAISNHLFSIFPASANVPPNESRDFYVTFAPTTTEFGRQEGEIVFFHNADGDSTVIFITGKGFSGRGDADGDGVVDALDVTYAIDFVLARFVPEAVQLTASDLFPFPFGDLAIDVRDLTVLTQAIARGIWPDGIGLPMEEISTAIASSGLARVVISPSEEEETHVEIAHNVPLRSLQFVFPSESDVSRGVRVDGLTVVAGYDESRREVRVLAFVADGGAVLPGTLEMTIPGEVGMPRFASAVDERRERMHVDASVSTAAQVRKKEREPVLTPHPNPYRPDAGTLALGMTADVRIFDVLGRQVYAAKHVGSWDGRDGAGRLVAPGLYIIRTESGSDRQSRPVTVVR